MKRRASAALVGLVTVVVCVVCAEGCRRHDPPPLMLATALTEGPVAFPPRDATWLDRAPLPPRTDEATLAPNAPIRVTMPTLDEKGHFEIASDTLQISFNDAVLSDPKAAPKLSITPAVKGKTTWDGSGYEVEFHPDKGFDPDVTYTVELPEITAPSGRKLAPFKATFRALPSIEVAGKTIHYKPERGRARVIAMLPSNVSMLGGAQLVTIVYDQPVDIAVAQRLVTFTSGDKRVPIAVFHPGGSVTDGQKVDPRFVVLAQPLRPLAPGQKLDVVAAAQKDDDPSEKQTFTIAQPTTFTAVACGYDTEDCESDGTKVVASHTASLELTWNNPLDLGSGDGKKLVTVTPKPKNLYVASYGGVTVSGSFEPSTRYTIHVAGTHDAYGGWAPPATVTFETRALPASATMSEGVAILDDAGARGFPVTTRNVAKAELELWVLPKDDTAAFARAVSDARSGGVPAGSPVKIPLTPPDRRDQLVDSAVDLSAHLERGRAYVARVSIDDTAHEAKPAAFGEGTEASKPAVAVLYAAGPDAIGAHVHRAGDNAVVEVFRIATGEPVANAKVTVGTDTVATDDTGAAFVSGARNADAALVSAGDATLTVPLSSSTTAETLFPEMTSKEDRAEDAVGMVVTDRGVYRPGSTIHVKALVRRTADAAIRAAAGEKVRLRVVDSMNEDVADQPAIADARGAIKADVELGKNVPTGRYAVRLELDDGKKTLVTEDQVRVAEFEAPKFKVDVEKVDAKPDHVGGRVVAKYLFGAPMGGAHVTWVLKKSEASVNGGKLAEQGLAFDTYREWWEGEAPAKNELKPVTGEGTLGADGTLAIDAETGPLASGPTDVLLEADVTDASYRHVSGQLRARRDPTKRHAGLRLIERFGEVGQRLPVDLGAVDSDGNIVAGAKVAARLERLTWTRTSERAQSGAVVESWHYAAQTISSCDATSAAAPVRCELFVPRWGDYRVVASVDGKDGASRSFYAWGGGEGRETVPGSGKKIPIVLDKPSYRPGETAKVLVRSPFAKATALLTLEQGGIVRHVSKRIEGAAATFDVPVTIASAPWIHAVVTLLPIGEREADYRVGAVRIAASAEDAKLSVEVASGKKEYQTRADADVTVTVKKNGAPVRNADVTLAIVDEGILRLTAFHAKDPVPALRPGRPLSFDAIDTRGLMIRRREKAHVAGGGDSEGEESLDTRRDFVETAAWLPSLVTDGEGRAHAKVKLPDNLTEFRMMAIAVDDVGGGGAAESSFVVTKPLLLEPVMPRFAARGDMFEAAAMVHNNTDAEVKAKVTVAGEAREITLAPKSRQKVAVAMKADRRGTRKMRFALEANGRTVDAVEIPLRVEEAGIAEHPQVAGAFGARQQIDVDVPEDVVYEDGAALSIKTGSALYPELGQRLSYLLDYPHGCVEQTTSSTIPLIAAKTILPWTGVTTLDDAALRKRIEAGVQRLSTMQTASGGLAYWPGGNDPNVFGTAYAMRALLRAKEMGIEHPKLVEGATKFLKARLHQESNHDIVVSIAEALAQAHALEPSDADMLWDTREKLDPFGTASLALALASIPKQDDRVKQLLDDLETRFDETGESKGTHDRRDWHYWGSEDRDRAQATIALTRLRPQSKALPILAGRLSKGLQRWTTQSTAWSLLALSDYIGTRAPDGSVAVSVKLEGKILDTFQKLGGDNKEVRVPLRDLAGKHVTFVLEGDKTAASAFSVEARWIRPVGAQGTHVGMRAANGVSIHRAYSDAAGRAIDLAKVKAGDIVRVAIRAELPRLSDYRRGYVAITDRLPAGLAPIDPELATTGSAPELAKEHPFYDGLSSWYGAASHVDLRDDRVQLYFDRTYSTVVYATYLTRATTRGTFVLPPANGELMYEPGSEGWSDAGKVTIE